MTLVKTSLLNAIAVMVKVASALVLNKVLAVYVGPAGYAVIGQFQNAVSIVVSIAGGLVATGVTKATAQHFDDQPRQHAVWQTAMRFCLGASLLAGFGMLFMADWLAEWLLKSASMSQVFVWLGLALPAMTANNLLLAIINGKKEVGIFVTSNIIGSLVSLLVIGLLASNFGLIGALIAFTINPAIVLLATALLVSHKTWFKIEFLWGQVNPSVFRELSGFGLMALTTALTMPITFMVIRDYLVKNLGFDAAGYWQASWKISEIYLMLITTTLTLYYLPRLAEIRTADEMKSEIFRVYRFVMPIVVAGALSIYLLRDFIILTLYTSEFLPMRELFSWQLAGDVIKIGAWVLAHIMLARAMVKAFVVTEISFAASFMTLSWLLVEHYGLNGMAMAYAINYTAYWLAMGYLVRNEMRKMKQAAQ